MNKAWHRRTAAALACILAAGGGAGWLAHARLQQLQAAFETDARIVHRLLSQRAVQHDAILSTLALLQPAEPGQGGADAALPRLPSVYPQILGVLRRPADGAWPAAAPGLDAAEAASRTTGHAALARPDLAAGRYHLVLASTPASYALHIDLHATVPRDEWPMDRAASPVRVTLEHAEPNLPAVLAEPVALQQIVHNLVVNALQALEQVPAGERRLELHLTAPIPGQVQLTVRDHGPGIAPEARTHLFEPFFTTRAGGLGLGLPLCESLAQAMGASLQLAPGHGRGAAFVLRLPAATSKP